MGRGLKRQVIGKWEKGSWLIVIDSKRQTPVTIVGSDFASKCELLYYLGIHRLSALWGGGGRVAKPAQLAFSHQLATESVYLASPTVFEVGSAAFCSILREFNW